MKVGIAGAGAIALASVAWLQQGGHEVRLWSPRSAEPAGPLRCRGVIEGEVSLAWAQSAAELAEAEVLLVAVPLNAHRSVFDALLPALHDRHTVIVGAMNSLSSLVLAEGAVARGVRPLVVSWGSTTHTARREGPLAVNVMTRRRSLPMAALPLRRGAEALALCEALFGPVFSDGGNTLAVALANVNPISHGPLALMNWTRIERGEPWAQYQQMTPRVAAVIEALDAERLAVAAAFGSQPRTLVTHFAQSFGTQSARLADIAAELHAARGGPPGPTTLATRFLSEDMPYGLAFLQALANVARVPVPAVDAVLAMATLAAGENFAAANDLLGPLRLEQESVAGLLDRVA